MKNEHDGHDESNIYEYLSFESGIHPVETVSLPLF